MYDMYDDMYMHFAAHFYIVRSSAVTSQFSLIAVYIYKLTLYAVDWLKMLFVRQSFFFFFFESHS